MSVQMRTAEETQIYLKESSFGLFYNIDDDYYIYHGNGITLFIEGAGMDEYYLEHININDYSNQLFVKVYDKEFVLKS